MLTMLALGRLHVGSSREFGCWRPAAWATAVDLPLLFVGYVTEPSAVPIEAASAFLVAGSVLLLAAAWASGSRGSAASSWTAGLFSVLTLLAGVVMTGW